MKNKETQCVHPLPISDKILTGIVSPIVLSTAYNYMDTAELAYPGFFSTHNQNRLGTIVSELEGGVWGIAFNSGMSAISSAIFSNVKLGEHIIFFNELYGGAWKLAKEELPKHGIACSFANKDLESFKSCLQENTKVIYLETPSNPLLSIIDLKEITTWAKEKNLITIVDNTFATPINQKPISLGADIVIHSGTKYLGGHNDLPFGAIAISDNRFKVPLLTTAKLFGGSLSPHACYMAERSIKTLALRVERQNENALRIAHYLESHQKIKKVYYPGLPSHKDHLIAKKQMVNFGGMLSFEADFEHGTSWHFLSHLLIIKPALSLGGVESLICVPTETSHLNLTNEEKERMGIKENLFRLSVGIENCNDLIKDLESALDFSSLDVVSSYLKVWK